MLVKFKIYRTYWDKYDEEGCCETFYTSWTMDENHVKAQWKSPVCVTPEAQVPLTLESKFRMTPIKS